MTKKINRVNLETAREIAILKATALEMSCSLEDNDYQRFPDILESDFNKLLEMILKIDNSIPEIWS